MEWSTSLRRWCGIAAAALMTVSIGCSGGSSGLAAGTGTVNFGANFLETDIRVDRDGTGGDASDVQICSTGLTVYAAWEDSRDGAKDIYFSKSTDAGDTWSTADVRVNTSVAGSSESAEVQIACSGNTVVIVWEDARNGENDIYFQRSLDGGATWLAQDVRLDQDVAGVGISGDPRIAVDGSNVYVVWEDDRTGSRVVYFRGSADGGTTFSDEAAVSNSVGSADRPRMAVAGARVYVVWHDNRDGLQDIYVNASTDRGATWLAADVRLDTDVAGAATSFDPAIDCDGDKVYVSWSDTRNGQSDTYFSTSTDAGTTFLATDVRLDTDTAGATFSFRTQVTCTADDKVYVVWIDNRTADRDVFMNVSKDGGATWLTDDVRIDTDDAGTARSDWVTISATGTNVYAAWQDNRDGSYDVRFNFSNDNGTTWQAVDMRTDTSAAGASDSRKPKIGHDGDVVFVVWADSRAGDEDIHCNSCQTR